MLVTDTVYPALDGVTTTTKAIADRMIDTGHDVGFIAPGPGLASYRRAPVARTSALAKTGRQVRAGVDGFAPHVLVAIDPGRVGRRALAHATTTGIPTLLIQQSDVSDPDAFTRRCAAHADVLLATSAWLADRLGREAARVWRPGVDAAAFSPALRDPWLRRHWSRAKSRTEPMLIGGHAGRLTKGNGARRLAELNRLTGRAGIPAIRPVVAGDGPQRGWLQEHLDDVRITGPLGTGDLAIALASFDALILPGEREGCGHLIREAAASGTPVIAPRSAAVPELVTHLESGYLYEPARPGALADAVAAVAADSQRLLLGEAAREGIVHRSWIVAADELIGLLPARRRHRAVA